MIVYLAGPIDLVSDGVRTTWRNTMKNELASRGISSFDPSSAFRYLPQDKKDAKKLIEINEHAMRSCDFVVFVMGSKTPSIGTPIELHIADRYDIPHCVIWEPTLESFDGGGAKRAGVKLPAYIQGLANYVFHRFDHALDHIVSYSRGRAGSINVESINIGSINTGLISAGAVDASKIVPGNITGALAKAHI